MKKAFRTPIVALAASIAMVAVGVTPAFAASESSILSNALAVKTVPSSALNMGGSSFDANLVNAAYAQWKGLNSNNAASLNTYQSSSSGTGRSGVTASTPSLNIGFSDVPLNYAGQDVSDTSQYVQVPVALGGVSIITNIGYQTSDTVSNKFGSVKTTTKLTSNGTTSGRTCAQQVATYPVALDGKTLGSVFAGSINSWNNPAIIAQNPRITVETLVPIAKAVKAKGKRGHKGYKAAVPQRNRLELVNCLTLTTTPAITVYSRTAGSGTTFIFRDFLSKADSAEYPTPSSAAFSAAAATFSNSAALAPAVAGKDGSIGYVEYGYALQNHLSSLRMKNAAGSYVSLTASSVSAAATAGLNAINANKSCAGGFSAAGPGTYNANSVNTQCFSITNVDAGAAYPIAGFSYAIVPKTIADANTATVATKFLLFLSQSGAGTNSSNTFGQNLAGAQAYVAMPKSIETVAYGLIGQINGGADLSATN
jgi:ABC-type phosphate transport system substrate-binding protein